MNIPRHPRALLRLTGSIVGALIFLTFSTHISAQGQRQKTDAKFSKEAKASLKAQQTKIKKELAAGDEDEWSGDYYYGDGLGVNVGFSMATKSGFAFTWHGCLGLYDLNYGEVILQDGRYKLQFHYPNKREGFEGIAPELIRVRWASRHYLIPADDFIHFVNAVNSGFEGSRESFSHRFLLKRGDEGHEVSGFPDVPTKYKSYLLVEPVEARLASIGRSKTIESGRITYVVINVGSAQGVKKGMEFYVHKPSTIFETVVVTSVSEQSSEAVIEQYGSKSPEPSKDWLLSTNALADRD